MTSDEFKKELFWTFNLNITKEGEEDCASIFKPQY